MRLVIVLALVLSGCLSAPTYYQAGATDQQWYADLSACQALAGQAAGDDDPYWILHKRYTDQCLRGKGWTPQ